MDDFCGVRFLAEGGGESSFAIFSTLSRSDKKFGEGVAFFFFDASSMTIVLKFSTLLVNSVAFQLFLKFPFEYCLSQC